MPIALSRFLNRPIGVEVNFFEGGVPETWTHRPPMPMPSAFTPSTPSRRLWTARTAGTLAGSVLERVFQRAQAGALGRDQHRHVAGLVLVLPHLGVGLRDICPVEDLAHAPVD